MRIREKNDMTIQSCTEGRLGGISFPHLYIVRWMSVVHEGCLWDVRTLLMTTKSGTFPTKEIFTAWTTGTTSRYWPNAVL